MHGMKQNKDARLFQKLSGGC
jgi:hypothetical protein